MPIQAAPDFGVRRQMTYHLVRSADVLHLPAIGGLVLRVDDEMFGGFCLIEYDSRLIDELRSRAKGLSKDDSHFSMLAEQIRVADEERNRVIRPAWFLEKKWARWPIQPLRLGGMAFDVCSKSPLPAVGNLSLQAQAKYHVKSKAKELFGKIEKWSSLTGIGLCCCANDDGIVVQVQNTLDPLTACSLVFAIMGWPSWNGVKWIRNCTDDGVPFDVPYS